MSRAQRNCHSRARLLGAWLLLSACSAGQAGQLDSGTFQPVINELDGQTLFAFDNTSIPFTRSLKADVQNRKS